MSHATLRHSRPSHGLSNRSPYRIVETPEEREGFLQQLPIANLDELIANPHRVVSHNTHVSKAIPACEASQRPPYRAACEHSRHLATGFKADPLGNASPRLALARRGGFPQAQGCGPCLSKPAGLWLHCRGMVTGQKKSPPKRALCLKDTDHRKDSTAA